MKKILISLILLIATNVYSQQIIGIGDLKIGMSNEQFLSLPDIKLKRIGEKNRFAVKPNANEILRMTVDTQLEAGFFLGLRVYSSDIIKYEFLYALGMPNYSGKDEYRIEATFYKDKLSKIHVWDAVLSFKSILEQKYGQPVVKDDTKIEICQNSYGAKTEHTSGTKYHKWGENESVEASFDTGSSAGTCGKYPYVGYTVTNKSDVVEITKITREGMLKAIAERNREKATGSKL